MNHPDNVSSAMWFLRDAELWLMRGTVFLIFLVGLYKVAADTLKRLPSATASHSLASR